MKRAHHPARGEGERLREDKVGGPWVSSAVPLQGRNSCAQGDLPNPHLQPRTHSALLGGHLLGRGIQGSSGPGADPAWGDHHHLALFGWELAEDVALEASQHDRLLQQELQLPQVGGA